MPDVVLSRTFVTFVDYMLHAGLSMNTVADYEREIRLVLAWFSARRVSLRDATPSLLVEYAATRPNTPGVRAHLRAALCHWWDWQEVTGWPGAIGVPTPPPMECKALEPDEALRVVDCARGWWRPGTATVIALGMGLRNQGIRELRWDRFDPPMEWYTTLEKGAKLRTVPVPPMVAAELDGRRNGSIWVFEGRGGGPVSHQTINNWVKLVGVKAGFRVDDVWPHRMRHTFAADALDNSGDLDAVAMLMGHSRTETTRGYTRTTRQRLRAASNALSYL